MSLVALALVLSAAVSHATWNLAAKRASEGGLAFVWLAALLATVLYAPVMVISAHPLSAPVVGVVVLSGLIHLGYFLLLQRGYRLADLSVVYPLARGVGPVLSVTGAILIFGERPTPVALIGAALVVVGIVVISTGRPASGAASRLDRREDSAPLDGSGPDATPSQAASSEAALLPQEDSRSVREHSRPAQWESAARRRRGGAVYGLAAGILIASYTLLDAAAVSAFAMAPIYFDWCSNAMRWALISPYAVRRHADISQVWRAHWREVLLVATLGPLGYILVLYAFTLAPVSLVAPARELSIVVGVVFGWWLLREPQGLRRLCGAAIVVAGVIALALS